MKYMYLMDINWYYSILIGLEIRKRININKYWFDDKEMGIKLLFYEEWVYWLPWKEDIYSSAEVNVTEDNLNNLEVGKSQQLR